MRHLPLDPGSLLDDNAVAAVWPSFEDALRARQPGLEIVPAQADAAGQSAERSVPDVPKVVGGMVVAAYVALLAVFFAFFAGSPLALFSITICAVFVAVFFTVPRLFIAVESDPSRRPSFSVFWHQGIQTLTGRTSGKDALVQMLIVPVFLTFGLLAMGIIGKIFIG